MAEMIWHKYPDEKPPHKISHYLTCDKYGKLSVKRWDYGNRTDVDYKYSNYPWRNPKKTMEFHSGWSSGGSVSNVTYWMELPTQPEEYTPYVAKRHMENELARAKNRVRNLTEKINRLNEEGTT